MTTNNPYIHKLSSFPNKIFDIGTKILSEKVKSQLITNLGRTNIVEIGSGSGGHIIELAAKNPGLNVFGFEIRFKRTVRTIEKANLLNLNNLFMIRGKAEFINQIFEPNTIDALYINFPDPWEKKSWLKNRIIQPHNLEIFYKLLSEQGYVSFKTDHLEYFQSARKLFEDSKYFKIIETTEDLYQSEYLEKNIPTEFERLFLSQGLKINYLKAVKI